MELDLMSHKILSKPNFYWFKTVDGTKQDIAFGCKRM